MFFSEMLTPLAVTSAMADLDPITISAEQVFDTVTSPVSYLVPCSYGVPAYSSLVADKPGFGAGMDELVDLGDKGVDYDV